jgi:alanine racemase
MIIPTDVRIWAEIDLSAIRHNLSVVREKIGVRPGIVAVVKANAYGHGLAKVAEAIAGLVELFGVANVEEAHELTGLNRDILLLSPSAPGERREVVARRCIATVSTATEAADFAGGRVNFKVDTGMGRIGCWEESALEELGAILRLNTDEVHSISTHLPVPDEDAAYTLAQLGRFAELAKKFRTLAPAAKIHALNSAGILGFPEHTQDLVRPGIMLYGSAYPAKFQPLLRPALTWKARVLLVRRVGPNRGVSYVRTFVTAHPMRIASLAVGSPTASPAVRAGRSCDRRNTCPVLGRDDGPDSRGRDTVPEVAAGDEAVLIGQQGGEEILARELAEKAGTIPGTSSRIGSRCESFISERGSFTRHPARVQKFDDRKLDIAKVLSSVRFHAGPEFLRPHARIRRADGYCSPCSHWRQTIPRIDGRGREECKGLGCHRSRRGFQTSPRL